MQFITAPWASYLYNPNEVEFAQPQADALFWALAHDTKLPRASKHRTRGKGHGAKATPTPTPTPSASQGPVLTVSPIQVKVTILNGDSGADETKQVAAAMGSRGLNVLGTGYGEGTT